MQLSPQATAIEPDKTLDFRSRSLADRSVLSALSEYYEEWANGLSEPQYTAIRNWGTPAFKDIHSALRAPPRQLSAEIEQEIKLLRSALECAPPLPISIQSVFRGENHKRLTLESALALVTRGDIREEESFLATTVTENDAFLFARDYHNSSPILRDSFLAIPLGWRTPDEECQVIYEIRLPEDRSWFSAAYIGNSVGEVLFRDHLILRYVDAQIVRYVPEEDYKCRHRVPPRQWDSRLFVTLEPIKAGEAG
jgi:hypothetical protein